jgi:hypothetical protein
MVANRSVSRGIKVAIRKIFSQVSGGKSGSRDEEGISANRNGIASSFLIVIKYGVPYRGVAG